MEHVSLYFLWALGGWFSDVGISQTRHDTIKTKINRMHTYPLDNRHHADKTMKVLGGRNHRQREIYQPPGTTNAPAFLRGSQ